MSGQDVGFFDVGADCPDMVIENGDLKAANGLENAVLISFFSNKRVTFEQLASDKEDRQGWWADLVSEPQGDEIGSRLWLIEKRKIVNSTILELESIMKDALQWLIEDGIAERVVIIDVSRTGPNTITGNGKIERPDGDNIPFGFIWDGQRLKLVEEQN